MEKSEVLEDLKIAMKEKNTSKLEAVRAVKAAIDKFEKENPNQDVNYVKVLKPLIKQREDSIAQFKVAGNQELINKETAELEVINSYLVKIMPTQMTSDDLIKRINEYVYSTGSNTGFVPKNKMGSIMSWFKENFDGQYDGKELSILVKNVLA